MSKWTDAELKRQVIEELKDYAREYDMTLEEFKKYVDYFLSYNETRMF